MKLYDSFRAPNPRRVRIFFAEKGVPLASVLAELDRREGLSGLAEKAARG